MSGFEIAGVILGALPLIIAALKACHERGLDKKLNLGKWWNPSKKAKNEYKRCCQIGRMRMALVAQQQLIQGEVDLILMHAGVPNTAADGAHLGYGSLEAFLLKPEIEEAVKAYLRERHSSYLEILADCERILVETAKFVTKFTRGSWVFESSLAGMLAANRDLNSISSDFWRDVKFEMQRTNIEEAIHEVDEATKLLRHLGEQTREIRAMMPADPNTKSTISFLQKVRMRAVTLHRALSRSWASHCQGVHKTRLHLEPRIGPPAIKDETITFRVTLDGHDGPSSPKTMLYTCEVRHFGSDDVKQKSKIRFAQSDSASTVTPKPVTDGMCHVISRSYNCGPEMLTLYIGDGDDVRMYHYRTLPCNSSPTIAWPPHATIVSLRNVLSSVGFHFGERVKMAAVIASSVIQLTSTPWISGLTKDDIFFGQEGSGQIDFQHPFVLHKFDAQSVDPAPARSKVQGRKDLLELGILIIELWENKRLEDFAFTAGLPLESTYDSRKRVAQRWLDEAEKSFLFWEYKAAVSCVECGFEATVMNLDDDELKGALIRLVVKPLWRSSGGGENDNYPRG